MTTKQAERPVKELEEYSRSELVALLAKQNKLLSDGIAAKLPDKGEKIKKSIEKIEKLIKELPENPVEDLENTFKNTLTLKPKPVAIPAASMGDLIEIPTEPHSPEVIMSEHLPQNSRPLIHKLFEETNNPEYNRLRKEHLDLFVRGRRGTKRDEKKGFKGSVALGLEEAIHLRDSWRDQDLLMGDENERTIKYDTASGEGQDGDGEEREYEEDEGAVIELDEEMSDMNIDGGKETIKSEKKDTKGRKPSAGKVNKQQQPVWDLQEDMKDILDMIPQEYKQPQRR